MTIVSTSEKMLKDADDIATADQKYRTLKSIVEVKDALQRKDLDEIEVKRDALQKSIYELSFAMYTRTS